MDNEQLTSGRSDVYILFVILEVTDVLMLFNLYCNTSLIGMPSEPLTRAAFQ